MLNANQIAHLTLRLFPMLTIFLPSPIRKIYFLFKDIFLALGFSYNESCAILLYFLLGAEGLCDLVRKCPWSPSVSSLSRAARKFEPIYNYSQLDKEIDAILLLKLSLKETNRRIEEAAKELRDKEVKK